jgi:Tfp pilus assembly protein PilN
VRIGEISLPGAARSAEAKPGIEPEPVVYQTLAELQESLGAMAPGKNGTPARVLVEIEPPVLQARTLTDLPPVRRRALEGLVALSAGRFFRQNGVPLVSAAAWVAGGKPGERIVRAVAVELPLVEAITEGVGVSRNVLVDIVPSRDVAPPLSLLPPRERERRQARWRRRVALGVIAVAALWIISLGGAWLWLTRENRALAVQLEDLREPAAALRRARATMDSAVAMLAALEHTRRQRAAFAERLAAVVSALPESTVITELQVAGDGIRITGQARSAAHIAPALAQVASNGGVRVSVQGSSDTIEGLPWERFSATLKGSGQ